MYENDKTYGAGSGKMFFAKVINVKDDKTQSGRVQIQIMGGSQGEQGKEQSYWANPVFGATNPMQGGVGGTGTGVLKDSIVTGYFAADGLPMFNGTVGASNTDKNSDKPIGKGRKHDLNKHSRDEGEMEGGDYRFDADKNDYGPESVTKFGYEVAPNTHGRTQPKEKEDDDGEDSWSMGSYKHED